MLKAVLAHDTETERKPRSDSPKKNSAGPPTNSPLFPNRDVRRNIDQWLGEILDSAARRVQDGPVNAAMAADTISRHLDEVSFTEPKRLEDVLSWVVSGMIDGVVHVNHQRYFGLFNPTPSFAAECAERIVAAFNPQLATATTSPFPVALESHLTKAIAFRAGMPASAVGHFTTGGTEANATALICALTHLYPRYANEGIQALPAKPAVYTSADAHLAWVKIAHQSGIGRAAIRLVNTDGSGRMDPESLRHDISADINRGYVPILICSTAGTTGAGMIDPLRACGDIAKKVSAWHHIDAAWGGALVVSDRLRPLLDGIGTADSITIDAHKWLATTMGCGMFLTARPDVLRDAFDVSMDCMPSSASGLDPYLTTMQWSRRFLGLRLFVGLATVGWAGYAQHIEKSLYLCDLLADQLLAAGWTRENDSSLGVLCMCPPAGYLDSRRIAQAVVQDGEAWISTVMFENRSVVRFCITSGETTESDIERLVACLRKHGA